MNKEIRFARAFWDGNGVHLVAESLGDPFDAEDFWNSVLALAHLAEIHIPKLQERYGGQIPFGPALPPKQQILGGYL
jgi:hypothetical protein